jgi:Ni/Co efflux regulator RcnB
MKTLKVVISICAATLLAAPAFADKPEWAGKGKGKHSENRQGDNDQGGKRRTEARFDSRDRDLVRVYFGEEERRGFCPPGLAKKNNGCMPPGQAKKWAVGRPLPRDVVFYDVPPRLVVQLGVPPSGHKYVRVASDILLIAVGSAMVIDAIQDLGRI